jgi:uncharacterized phage protein (TIGR02220 family)
MGARGAGGKGGSETLFTAAADRLIDAMNECGGTHFRHSATSREPFVRSLSDGWTEEQLRVIVAHKAAMWLPDPEMNEYYRPETVNRITKMEAYWQAAERWAAQGKPGTRQAQREKDEQAAWDILHGGGDRGRA